ncbi:MAG TPA: EpsI family protein [Bryobacteraceae bacterium]|nr:EpsI family protein [Bryobacteraceae bacterium]
MKFLKSPYARILTIVLLLQTAAFYALASRAETIPVVRPLADFPFLVHGWRMVQDLPLDPDVEAVLKADDTLNRVYINAAESSEASLFVAFFKTQRTGQSPHSPKNCLPGSGWEPTETGGVTITVPGREAPVTVNRYVVQKGEAKSVVLYWYQSHNRIIASEYAAKFWLVADSIRYHRSDTALVRVVVPVRNNDSAAATRIAVGFVQSFFPDLEKQLPL